MRAIVCVDKNWAIGKDEKLLFELKEDLKHFEETTKNMVCVMGYKTFESLPNGPLNDRINVALTRKNIKIKNAIVCNNFDELKELLKHYDTNNVYIIGGQLIYEKMLPYCHDAIVTKVEINKNGNKFFPNIDNIQNWQLISAKNCQILKNFQQT